MFERFTQPARNVVVAAQNQARALDHRLITTPHLLLSLLETDGGDLLRGHGLTAQAVRAELAALVQRDPHAADDDAAVLAAIGIDVARIRAAVEANFGPGALDRQPPPQHDPPGLFGRLARFGRRPDRVTRSDEVTALRRLGGRSAGHLPFSPSAKKVLELSLREALRLGDHHIGTEHLTLGLLRCTDGAAAALLDRLGVNLAAVRRDAEQRLRRTA